MPVPTRDMFVISGLPRYMDRYRVSAGLDNSPSKGPLVLSESSSAPEQPWMNSSAPSCRGDLCHKHSKYVTTREFLFGPPVSLHLG